jgi:hypothetical protein
LICSGWVKMIEILDREEQSSEEFKEVVDLLKTMVQRWCV